MTMKLSAYSLDHIATDLSKFTQPDIPNLTLPDDRVLQTNALESILGVFSGQGNARVRRIVTNIVRRVFASKETYELGRQHAFEYVAGDRERISLYFLALTEFETCIAYIWQIADFLRVLSGIKVYEPGDRSDWERIHDIYTFGTKHYDDKATAADVEQPTAIWLTNNGITDARTSITYHELAETIVAGGELFKTMVNSARAHRSTGDTPQGPTDS